MEVISISSDSEASISAEDIKVDKSSPLHFPSCEDSYNVDWNDDAYSPINYESEAVDIEPENNSDSEEKIENLITPVWQNEKNIQNDFEIENADDTLNYLCNFNSSSICDSVKRSDLPPVADSENLKKITCSSSHFNVPEKSPVNKAKQNKQTLSQEEKEKVKNLREQKKLEREMEKEKKKAEQLKQKAYKAALSENQRNLKPEENIKFLRVHIDNEIINLPCGGNIISVLQQNNIQYVVESQITNFTITWSKRKTEKVVSDFGEVTEKTESKEEEQLLYVLNWQKAVELVYSNELLTHVETIKSVSIDKNLTLIIYEIGKYFDYKKIKKNRGMKAEVNDKRKVKPKEYERVFEEAPNISKDQLELALTELQLLGKHNCRLLETPEELSGLVLNFTKSLSQIDYKLDKQKRQGDNLGWFGKGDSNQCVKVDKNGNGLLQLWQQQICQFSNVGWETAQAIASLYCSPLALVNHYNGCESSEQGELLLQNIQIRRDAGILSSSRRVGPQLSKKLYKFFTSDDPDEEL